MTRIEGVAGVLAAGHAGEPDTILARSAWLHLTVVRHDAIPVEAANTLALNLAVAAALNGLTAFIPVAALPEMMRPESATAAPRPGARSRAWALPLVRAASADEAMLRPRATHADLRCRVRISVARCLPTDGSRSTEAVAGDGTPHASCRHVTLLPVSDALQLRDAATLVGGTACTRIVLPRTIARRTDRWALVEHALDVAGTVLCRTTVPFGRRDRVTLYAPPTRAAHAYAALLSELRTT